LIFLTVGAQMPFDRLVESVDAWAGEHPDKHIVAQIGRSVHVPRNMEWQSFLDPREFKRRYESARFIVAHAGTGSILTAMQMGKPILVMPRRYDLGETRSDHQLATARKFGQFPGVEWALDGHELVTKLNTMHKMVGYCSVGPYASQHLLQAIRRFIESV
jgi:UDP-N-acetylglucosamine transferase subunit ALG13